MKRVVFALAGKEVVCLFGTTVALLVCLLLLARLKEKPVHFDGLNEFKGFAAENSLFCYSNRESALAWNCLLVADHQLTRDRLRELETHHRRCGPAWRGVISVSETHSEFSEVYLDSISGAWRVFGNVVAVGDGEFIKRVERLWRGQ